MSYVALRHAADEVGWPLLGCQRAAEMSDATLRRELARAHALDDPVSARGLPRDRQMLDLRLAELDAEYLNRFPDAALSWPWPRHGGTAATGSRRR